VRTSRKRARTTGERKKIEKNRKKKYQLATDLKGRFFEFDGSKESRNEDKPS
jgi:hypothetical protein